MTISKLQQFQAVCRFQSITRAADHLHISQPSVSATIRELEQEFNVNLFRREGRQLILTAEGHFLLQHAERLLEEFDQLSLRMHDLGKNRNRFRIGIPPMSGTIFFPRLYKAFQERFPQITLSIVECGSLQAEKMLDQGELDIAMASIHTPPNRRFQVLKLGQSQLMLCVSPGHRLAHETSIRIAGIQQEPLVLFREDSAPSKVVLQLFAAQGLRPNVLLYSSQLSMIKQFISDGTAGAFLLDTLVQQDPEIIALPFETPVLFDTVLMWRRDQYLYSDVDSFIQFSRSFFME